MNEKKKYPRLRSSSGFWFVLLFLITIMSGLLVSSVKISYMPPLRRTYEIESEKVDGEIVVMMLSDLHGASFGKDNEYILSVADEIMPDFVVMVGDMFNHENEDGCDIDTAIKLIEALSKKYTVYYSMGNHELERIYRDQINVRARIEDAGGVLLERKYTDVVVKNQSIRIGGIYNLRESDNALCDDEADRRFFESFEDTENFTLLLEHRPHLVAEEVLGNGYKIDLALSGHLHGGQVVLPVFGGVWGGNWGLFPDYCLGEYKVGDTTLIVSAGLCIEKQGIPRVNNPTEITEIIIK